MLSPGDRLGRYEVVSPLGAGGMGEVYRALDSGLGREIALKVLPDGVASDPHRLKRFEREARAIAALSHPNVLTIFDVGQDGGRTYLVCELLEGATLGSRLRHGAFASHEALDVAMQVARGLTVTHGRGIVHRDLKPDNLFLTTAGVLKILDFGLARLDGSLPQATQDTTDELTRTGAVVGTVPYMSPEQAKGEPGDARSDIFSLGTVFFEMVSGQHPFRRNSSAETLSAILRDDPPELDGRVPAAVDRVVRRCLEKRPEDRFQTAHDLAQTLETLLTGPGLAGRETTGAARRQRLASRAKKLAIAAGLGIVAALAVFLTRGSWPHGPRPIPRVVPVTSYPGYESEPALSPDGTRLAFAWDGGDAMAPAQLHVKVVGEDRALRLTEGGTDDIVAPAWSPDGRRIAFLRPTRQPGTQVTGWNIWVVPSQGGKALTLGSALMYDWPGLSWSPDGKRLAIVDGAAAEGSSRAIGIALLEIDTGERRRLSEPAAERTADTRPKFSPDGRSLAFIREYQRNQSELVVQGIGGPARVVAKPDGMVNDADWLADGRGLVASISVKGEGTSRLWHVPLDGEAEPLGIGTEGALGVSTARQAPGLAFVRDNTNCNVWRMAGPAGDPKQRPVRLLASTQTDFFPRYSPDGTRIVFLSNRTGPWRLWVCDAEGRDCSEVPTRGRPFSPNWAPDSRRIVYVERELGNGDVYVTSVGEAYPRPLVESAARDSFPAWSRDGRFVYFASNRTGRNEIWRVPGVGVGEPEQVTREGGTHTDVSGDGRHVLYNRSRDWTLWRTPPQGGAEEEVLQAYFRWQDAWKPWRNTVVFFDLKQTPPVLRVLDLATRTTRDLGSVDANDNCCGLSVTPDGRWLLFGKDDGTGTDIVLAEGFR